MALPKLRSIVAAIAAALAASSAAQTPPAAAPLTQRRINEYAAVCVTAEMALSGLKGSPRPGEPAPRFSARIRSYFAALESAGHNLAALSHPPAPTDHGADNVGRWQRVAGLVSGLKADTAAARQAWAAYPRLKDRAQLGSHLLRCLDHIHALLNVLRDARP